MLIEIPDRLQLIKLPPSAEMTLFLIGEEMKNRRLINRLEQAGFNTDFSNSDLSILILSLVGFDHRPDELYNWYSTALDNACEKAKPSEIAEWREAVFDFYLELVERKRNDILT
jgi:hypothetical protein